MHNCEILPFGNRLDHKFSPPPLISWEETRMLNKKIYALIVIFNTSTRVHVTWHWSQCLSIASFSAIRCSFPIHLFHSAMISGDLPSSVSAFPCLSFLPAFLLSHFSVYAACPNNVLCPSLPQLTSYFHELVSFKVSPLLFLSIQLRYSQYSSIEPHFSQLPVSIFS